MATLSPFRFPGAKNKLLPIILEYLKVPLEIQPVFVDAFVGGGSVLLEVARQYPTMQLYCNDKDLWIASFWKIVGGNDIKKLDALLDLMSQQPTLKLFYKLREQATTDDVECAYRGIFFNRTCFSGIAKSNPIGGKDQFLLYANLLENTLYDLNKIIFTYNIRLAC